MRFIQYLKKVCPLPKLTRKNEMNSTDSVTLHPIRVIQFRGLRWAPFFGDGPSAQYRRIIVPILTIIWTGLIAPINRHTKYFCLWNISEIIIKRWKGAIVRCQVQCFKSCLHGTTPTTETTSRDKNMHDWIKLCTGGSSGDRIEKKCIISIGFHRDKYAKSPVGTSKKYSLWCHMIVLSLFDTCLVTWPALRDNRNMDLKTYVSNLRIT